MHKGINREQSPLDHHTVLISPDASPSTKTTAKTNDLCDKNTEAVPLVDLLMQASDTIRRERERAATLEQENVKLRAQLDGVRRAYRLVATQRALRSSQALEDVAALSTADEDKLFAYVREQLMGSLEYSSSKPEGRSCTSKSTNKTRPRQPQRTSSAAVSPMVLAAARAQPSSSRAAARSRTKRNVSTPPPPDSRTERATEQHPSVPAKTRAEHGNSYSTLQHGNLKDGVSSRNIPEGRRGGGGTSAEVGSIDTKECPMHSMACRLLRALAPRPTHAILGDIVHTMVIALQRDVQARLNTVQEKTADSSSAMRSLAMVRLQPCVYRLIIGPPAEVKTMERAARRGDRDGARSWSPKRHTTVLHRDHFIIYGTGQKDTNAAPTCHPHVINTVVHLTLDGGTLRVIRGGGHVDFLDYVQRHLRIAF
ncbi:hypothetical protein JKF63_07214 [Porcisia hertigi]|uniref:Uncharacterized protein n=1 Tax=Porcisia hertigi TaxID=2761500 RepID=A0A836LL82_9TRYP|nr:hypothetical protein JKF63_07214 [Porcisia hertigi]